MLFYHTQLFWVFEEIHLIADAGVFSRSPSPLRGEYLGTRLILDSERHQTFILERRPRCRWRRLCVSSLFSNMQTTHVVDFNDGNACSQKLFH